MISPLTFGKVRNPCGDCMNDYCTMNCSGRDVIPESEIRRGGQIAALDRLIKIARSDTGQAQRCANFLLAWWNATRDGGFDLTDLWNVDRDIQHDMVTVFELVAESWAYPDKFDARYQAEFEGLVTQWRGKKRRKRA